jgi:hypothetical protein
MKRFMKYLIAIIGAALFSTAIHAQSSVVHDRITARQSITVGDSAASTGNVGISTKNPTQKLDVNGGVRVRALGEGIVVSDATGVLSVDSVLVLDSIILNYIYSNKVRVNRDSFTDPAATIASISDSGQLVECFTCDTIQLLLDSTYNSPFTYNGTGDIVQRDTTLNVGIGTSAPSAKLHVDGSVLVNDNNIDGFINSTLISGADLYLNESGEYNSGLAIKGVDVANPNIKGYVGVTVNEDVEALEASLVVYDTTELLGNEDYIYIRKNIISAKVSNGGDNSILTISDNGISIATTGFISIDNGTQADGYVLTSDASGNATWQDPTAYGEMGFGDSTRTIALTQNVFSVVTNSNNTLWSTAAVDLHNVTYSGDSLIIDSAGTYQVNVQLSVDGATSSVIRLGVFLNGVLACTCTGYQELVNNHIIQLSYINIDALNAGDVVQVVITNTANSDDVDAIAGKLTVNRIK